MEHHIISERCKTMRALGREALRGKWGLAIGGTIVLNLALFVPSYILNWLFLEPHMNKIQEMGPAAAMDPNMAMEYVEIAMAMIPGILIICIYTILVTGPLYLGYSIFSLSLFRNQKASIGQIFYGFEKFGKALGVTLMVGLLAMVWMIPGAICMALIPFAGFVLFFAAMIMMFITLIKYSQTFYILADQPEIGVMECLRKGKWMMTGNKGKFFLLYLSFIGWFLLAALPTGITSGVEAAGSMSAGGGSGALGIVMTIVGFACQIVLGVYVTLTEAGFYELLTGNLRPGVIKSTAEIVQEPELLSAESKPEPERSVKLGREK